MSHPMSTPGPLARLWETFFLPLCKLNRIQFAAPWNAHRPGC